MSPHGRGRGLAVGLCLLFLISMIPSDVGLVKSASTMVEQEATIAPSTPIGQATTLTIGSWPDGANERVGVSVGDGYAIKSMDLELQPNVLPNSLASTLADVGDFDDNSVYDGMDVNKSALQILPQDWQYDFESGSFEPEWSLGGTSNWRIQSGVVIQGLNTAQGGTITHNQESSMTLDVSQLPASSGSFKYRVSSEGVLPPPSSHFLPALNRSHGNIPRMVVSTGVQTPLGLMTFSSRLKVVLETGKGTGHRMSLAPLNSGAVKE